MESCLFTSALRVLGPTVASLWILACMAWALAATPMRHHAGAPPRHRRRLGRTGLALAALLILTLASGLMPAWASALAAAAVFCLYATTDPDHSDFWHHRRIRPVALATALTGGLALGLLAAAVHAAGPLVFATLVCRRYLASVARRTAQAAVDLEALKFKILTLDAALRRSTLVSLPDSSDDKLPKAG